MQQQPQRRLEIDKYERTYLILALTMIGVFFAAVVAGALILNVHTPDSGEFVNPLTLGQDSFTELGLFDRGNNTYDVYVLAQMWQFNLGPDTEVVANHQVLRIPLDARVTFHVASRDINHGFFIQYNNINLQLVPGHIARQSVLFDRPGNFWVVCHEYCGRGHQQMGFMISVEEGV
jgi:cytochrome c oxidase subunit 2